MFLFSIATLVSSIVLMLAICGCDSCARCLKCEEPIEQAPVTPEKAPISRRELCGSDSEDSPPPYRLVTMDSGVSYWEGLVLKAHTD